ncbi:hypothetical protein SDC9_76481 [bioreactor metagenome]|uniref:Uncharacterized protein n=1 Tax=bioreactor metagenome TaxID=1076179 RepID=A0A644YNP9_9ZZZZ
MAYSDEARSHRAAALAAPRNHVLPARARLCGFGYRPYGPCAKGRICDPHPRGRHAAPIHNRYHGQAGRMGGRPPRSRWCGVHRPAGCLRDRAMCDPRGTSRSTRRPQAAQRVLHRCHRCGRGPVGGHGQSGHGDR